MTPQIHNIAGIPTAIFDSSDRLPVSNDCLDTAIFIHGNPGPMDDWFDLIPNIVPIMRTIAIDLPGFGRSARPVDFNYAIPGYVQHLNAIIEHLKLERVHLILHDFGGAFGLWWASKNPNKVVSITLINIGILCNYRWHLFARVWQTPVIGEMLSALTTPSSFQCAINFLNPTPLPRKFFEQATRYLDWKSKKAILKLYRATRDSDVWFGDRAVPSLQSIVDINTCVIWGEQDKFLPVRYAKAQKDFFTNVHVYTIPQAGHWPFVDKPDAVQEILISFLEQQTENVNKEGRESDDDC